MLGEDQAGGPRLVPDAVTVPYPFASGAELLERTQASGLPISGVMLANELGAQGRGGDQGRAAADLVGHAGVRRGRVAHAGRAARRA